MAHCTSEGSPSAGLSVDVIDHRQLERGGFQERSRVQRSGELNASRAACLDKRARADVAAVEHVPHIAATIHIHRSSGLPCGGSSLLRAEGREGGRAESREGGREGGKQGGRKGGREGGREGEERGGALDERIGSHIPSYARRYWPPVASLEEPSHGVSRPYRCAWALGRDDSP